MLIATIERDYSNGCVWATVTPGQPAHHVAIDLERIERIRAILRGDVTLMELI